MTRLIPTLIFIGNPKCGSTFLWDCVRSGIFDPSNICGKDSAGWRTCERLRFSGLRLHNLVLRICTSSYLSKEAWTQPTCPYHCLRPALCVALCDRCTGNRRYLITAFGPRKEFNFYDKHFYKGHGWEWYHFCTHRCIRVCPWSIQLLPVAPCRLY